MNRKVLLIYTGGTIGMNRNAATGALEPFNFEELQQRVPELGELPTAIDVHCFDPPIDSSDMTPHLWTQLANIIAGRYHAYDGFVILHGTDTMAYTASALSFMLEGLDKPVILTGSQLPLCQLRTDGKENVITSIEMASAHLPDGTARVPEVCIYFGGHLMRGNRTTKQSAEAFNAFESFNYPHLAEAGVNIVYHDENILRPAPPGPGDHPLPFAPTVAPLDDSVIIVTLFPGLRDDLISHIIAAPGLRSIVMRTFGSGNAPHSPSLLSALSEGTRRGKVIVNVSQCLSGSVEMSRYDAGRQLLDAGVISARDATVEATVTKLMYLQAHHESVSHIRKFMEKNIRGEMTEQV